MKKNLLFIGMLFLGISMIISSLILSVSINQENQLNGILNGTFNMSEYSGIESDIIMPYGAGIILGYDQDTLIQNIENGKLEGIPYTKIGDNYIFSKKALEEWVYSKTLE